MLTDHLNIRAICRSLISYRLLNALGILS